MQTHMSQYDQYDRHCIMLGDDKMYKMTGMYFTGEVSTARNFMIIEK